MQRASTLPYVIVKYLEKVYSQATVCSANMLKKCHTCNRITLIGTNFINLDGLDQFSYFFCSRKLKVSTPRI